MYEVCTKLRSFELSLVLFDACTRRCKNISAMFLVLAIIFSLGLISNDTETWYTYWILSQISTAWCTHVLNKFSKMIEFK